MLRKYFVFLILVSFYPNVLVFAWSSTGHGIVGDIAYSYLSPLAKSRVNYYIQGRSVRLACTWMDSVKSIRSYSYLTQRHYVNVNKGDTYDTTSTNDVVFELKRVIGQLYKMNNLNDSLITQYVLEIFHLVGDIHQPLHCGYSYDAGGNGTQVSFLGQYTNLHSVWDFSMVSSGNVNLYSCLSANQFTQSEIKSIQKIDVLQWMNESIQLVDTCYYPAYNNTMDSNYLKTRLPIVKQQLLKAGIRLASVLETLFGANSPLPLSLLSFDIQSSNEGNNLFWETNSNKNITKFFVERSKDGMSFNTIGVVESSQFSGLGSYHFVDFNSQGEMFYRLKIVFKNSPSQYSAVEKANLDASPKSKISVSPNPAKSVLNIRFFEQSNKTVNIKMLGLDGKVYKTKQYELIAGTVSLKIDLAGVQKGVYLLFVEGIGMQKVFVE